MSKVLRYQLVETKCPYCHISIQIPLEYGSGLKNSITLCPKCQQAFAIVNGITLPLSKIDDMELQDFMDINPSKREKKCPSNQ